MITEYQRTRLHRLIDRHVFAEIDLSWAGGGDPADIPAIQSEARAAKKALAAYTRSLVEVKQKELPLVQP